MMHHCQTPGMQGKLIATALFRRFACVIWLIGGCLTQFSAAEDESAHHLPDPLIFNNGSKVETASQWKIRREEMKGILDNNALGTIPPPPGNVKGQDTGGGLIMEGRANYRRVHLTFGPENKLALDLALFIPPSTGTDLKPFPTIVFPSFKPVPGPDEDAGPFAKQFEPAIARGYAVASFYYQQCAADLPNARETGFLAGYPKFTWGTLAAWAWGMSRCVDYLESQPFVDHSKLIALGHSRLGKAALIAGAYDERFALTAPAGSGCGGTGAYRFCGKDRGGKEGLEDMTKRFPQWFVPKLSEYSGRVEELPFDQHWLIALVAPRWFIAADGLDDPYANGNALAQSYLAAKPVYALLGVTDHLGIHFRPGKHLLATEDWQAVLDFSDQDLRKMDLGKHFDELPPAEKLK